MTELEQIKSYLTADDRRLKIGIRGEFKISFLAQGEYNKNYLITDQAGQQLVFRMNFGTQIGVDNQIKYEYQALQHLAPSGKTPWPIYLDDTQSKFNEGILIEQYLVGRPLDYHTDLAQAAQIFAAIHALPVTKECYRDLIVEDQICSDRLNEADRLLAPVRQAEQQLGARPLRLLLDLESWCQKHADNDYFKQIEPSIVNTEVNSHNFVIGSGASWLIDWEKPVISNPVQDLTQFLADTTTLWRDGMLLEQATKRQFLMNYSQLRGLDGEQVVAAVTRYMPYLLLRALAWCANLMVIYDTKPIQNREIYDRCCSYFQVDFLEQLLRKSGVL